jgi:hypothetical protein
MMRLLALCKHTDPPLRSLRDLRGVHLPMLEVFSFRFLVCNIMCTKEHHAGLLFFFPQGLRSQVYALAAARWQYRPEQLRLFFHYLPTFVHLHVHIAGNTSMPNFCVCEYSPLHFF